MRWQQWNATLRTNLSVWALRDDLTDYSFPTSGRSFRTITKKVKIVHELQVKQENYYKKNSNLQQLTQPNVHYLVYFCVEDALTYCH